ncbi:thioesterase II family protein [Micromonospora sp. DT201]|uniref:thioesterase II family protein n=1 Tax=Micromonospora sp. DT201 TaxID=3393442 RepID=UPI003CF53280
MSDAGNILVRPRPRPDATRTLLCFGACGGGTSVFRPWADAVDGHTELALYCYPGRENRFGDPFATDWRQIVDEATEAATSLGDRELVLLGHSMGAWVAFEVARRLESGGGPAPVAVVASASDAPTRWSHIWDRPPTPDDSDAELLGWMERVGQVPRIVLEEPDLADLAVEVFRADMAMADTYRYKPGSRITTPVQVWYGADDDEVDREAALRWREVTAGGCDVTELPGGHFYTGEVWSGLPGRIQVPIRPGVPGAAGPTS